LHAALTALYRSEGAAEIGKHCGTHHGMVDEAMGSEVM